MKLLEKKDKNERLKNETYVLTKRDPKTLKKFSCVKTYTKTSFN